MKRVFFALLLPLASAHNFFAAPAGIPTGRWDGEVTGGAPSGHLGNPGHNVPFLGNGYMGVIMQSSSKPSKQSSSSPANYNGSSLNLYINSNVNWDCEVSAPDRPLPPALCSMRGFGGLTINAANTTTAGQQMVAPGATFDLEQRMDAGSLWTRRSSPIVGSNYYRLETATVMRDDVNVMLTQVDFYANDPAAFVELQLTIWTLGHTTHVRASAASACAVGSSNVSVCSRRYNSLNTKPSTLGFFSPWTAIANRVVRGDNTSVAPTRTITTNEDAMSSTTSVYVLRADEPLSIITTIADNLLAGNTHNPSVDPSATASTGVPSAAAPHPHSHPRTLLDGNTEDPSAAAAGLALRSQPDTIVVSSRAFWARFWNASSVSLPSRPALERMWYGAQYATVGATASEAAVTRSQGRLPPPGLYGPFATADYAFWNGDFTLDYNQQATFYHVYSSNHPERAAAYFAPILDYMPAARVQAQQIAKTANLTCDARALSYPCHLAPWGYQSRDKNIYMQWNGHYAAMLFVNAWEYTRDAAFATNVTLPLLDGLNAWTHCYLRRNSTGGAAYTLNDWNPTMPDQIFENRPAHNPSTGLSLMRRTAAAQRDIATAVGQQYPSYVDDILAHLAPLPVTRAPGGQGVVWATSDDTNWTQSSAYTRFASVLFPIWPSETVSALSTDAATERLALASTVLYANLTCGGHYPEAQFPGTCVNAGWGGLTIFPALARILPGAGAGGMTAAEMADAFETYVNAYGANSTNFLAYAPGGGVENVGLSQAVNDMLMQSSAGTIHLFPAWPPAEPASFTTLRAKGAYLVSAAWDPVARAATGVRIAATVASPHTSLANPFGATVHTVALQCTGAPPRTLEVDSRGTIQWQMIAGEACQLSPDY